jgi:uncharacterized protein (DUF2164 family)
LLLPENKGLAMSEKEKQAEKEEQAHIVQKLKDFFEDERDETLGDLPAKFLADFIEKELGPYFFNRGVKAAKAKTLSVFANLDEELEYLEMLVPKGNGRKPPKGKG